MLRRVEVSPWVMGQTQVRMRPGCSRCLMAAECPDSRYMMNRRAQLDALVAALAEQLAVGRHESGANLLERKSRCEQRSDI